MPRSYVMTDQFDEVWNTEHQGPIKVRDMKRSHIRNSLQWVMRRQDRTVLGTEWDSELGGRPYNQKDKDGLYYRDWIALFTARLLDPELPE